MATFTTTGKYRQGVVKPDERPRFKNPDEVVVTFVKYQGAPQKDGDEALFRKIEPQYRKIRREVFQKLYPRLYEKYYKGAGSR